MSNVNNRQLDSFTLEARDMTPADIPALHELSVAVGWMHRAEDWAVTLELGEGIFLTDEIGGPSALPCGFPCRTSLQCWAWSSPHRACRNAARDAG